MGNDGGSFSRTQNLKISRTDRDNVAKDDNTGSFAITSKWGFCRLSNKQLQLPIVSDYKGNLFNKEAILEWLLTPGREDYSDEQIKNFSHIKRLDDVIDLKNLEETRTSTTRDKSRGASPIVCKYGDNVLGESTVQFIYLTKCGDVLPKRSLQMVYKNLCPHCSIPYEELDVISIYSPSPEDARRLENRYQLLKQSGIYHNGKMRQVKRKKRNKEESISENSQKQKRMKS